MDQHMQAEDISDETFPSVSGPTQLSPPTQEASSTPLPMHFDISSEPDEHLPQSVIHDPLAMDPAEERPAKKQTTEPQGLVKLPDDRNEGEEPELGGTVFEFRASWYRGRSDTTAASDGRSRVTRSP